MKKKSIIIIIIIIILIGSISGLFFYLMENRIEDKSILLSKNESFQSWPDLYEDKVVWVDNRHGNLDIYYYNISTGEEKRITTNEADQLNPSIYNNIIAWTDYRSGGYPQGLYTDAISEMPERDTDVFYYDLNTNEEFQITYEGNQSLNLVYKNNIYFYDSQIQNYYKYNVLTKNKEIFDIPGYNFDIYEDKVVYLKNSVVYLLDLENNVTTQISDRYEHNDRYRPRISGQYIAWEDYTRQTNIFVYDINEDKEIIIPASSSYPHIGIAYTDYNGFDIYGKYVVTIEDDKTHSQWDDYDDVNDNMYIFNIETKEKSKLSLPNGWRYSPVIFKDKIVWSELRDFSHGRPGGFGGIDYNEDIYLYEINEQNDHIFPITKEFKKADSIYEVYILKDEIVDEIKNNWTINKTEIIDNKTIKVIGNLTITQNGSLTFKNSIVGLDNLKNGHSNIIVNGKLSILQNSIITSTDINGKFNINCQNPRSIILDSSEIYQCGWDKTTGFIITQNHTVSNITIKNSKFMNNYYGFKLTNISNLSISDNIFINNEIGVYFEECRFLNFNNNDFIYDFVVDDNRYSVWLYNSSFFEIENIDIKNGGYGIKIENGFNNVISHCNITGNYYGGIILTGEQNEIFNVIIENCYIAVTIGGFKNTISDSKLFGGSVGIKFFRSYDDHSGNHVIERNEIFNNNSDGIYLSAKSVVIRENDIHDNEWPGISIWGGGETFYAEIYKNTFSNNGNGIVVHHCSRYHKIYENVFVNDDLILPDVEGYQSETNEIYDNTFIDD